MVAATWVVALGCAAPDGHPRDGEGPQRPPTPAADPPGPSQASTACTGAIPTRLALDPTANVGVSALAVDAEHVYWATQPNGRGELHRIKKQGGAVEELGTFDPILHIASISGGVLLSTWTGIVRVDEGGATAVLASTATWSNGIADDGTWVYFDDYESTSGRAKLARVPRDGGAVERFDLDTLAIASDASGHYAMRWVDPYGRASVRPEIITWAADPRAARALAATPGRFGALTLDDDTVYVASIADPAEGTITAVPKTGGAPRVLAERELGAGTIAVDGAHVYWTSGNRTSGVLGSVRSSPKDRAQPYDIAHDVATPIAIAADGTNVYWLEFGDGRPPGTGGVSLWVAPAPRAGADANRIP